MPAARLLAQHGLDAAHIDPETEASVRYFTRTAAGPAPDPGTTIRFDPDEAIHHVHRFGSASRQAEAARAAYRNGQQAGWRAGYISGMHWGMVAGAICTALLIFLSLELSRIYGPAIVGLLKRLL